MTIYHFAAMNLPSPDTLPLVDDFAVTVADDTTLEFVRPGYGRLAGFPAWEHAARDLVHLTPYDVPIGTREEPFMEEDEGWRIVIFEENGFVCVLEGDSPHAEEFDTAFRVRRERYLEAWAMLLLLHNPVTPLDEA